MFGISVSAALVRCARRTRHTEAKAQAMNVSTARPDANRWGGDDPQVAGLQSVILSRLLRGGALGAVPSASGIGLGDRVPQGRAWVPIGGGIPESG